MLLSVTVLVLSSMCLRCCESLPLYKVCLSENGVSKCQNLARIEETGFGTISKYIEQISMEDIPKIPGIYGLKYMTELSICCSNISLFPDFLEDLPALQTVTIIRNEEVHIKSAAFHQLSVKNIYIKFNSVCNLKDVSFLHLPSLEIVDLAYNSLKEWNPNAFFKTPKVRELHLIGNKLKFLPAEAFKNLKNLETIQLASNEIEKLHEDTFRGLNTLFNLSLQKNRLKSLPEKLFAPHPFKNPDGLTTYKKRQIKNLILESNYLQFLPKKLLDDLPKNVNVNIALNPWKCECYFKIMLWAKLNSVLIEDKISNFPICIVFNPTCVEEFEEDLLIKFFASCQTCPRAYKKELRN